MQPFNAPMRRPVMEARRTEIHRVQNVGAQDTWVMGRIQIKGVGEVRHTITFPLQFAERPMPIHGTPELDPNYSPKDGSYPTLTVTVSRWFTKNGSDGIRASDYYTGAELTMTATGEADQLLWASFAFMGTAITNVPSE